MPALQHVLVVVPIIAWVGLFVRFRRTVHLGADWRSAAIFATLGWSVFLAGSTEILSLAKAISWPGLLAFWAIVAVFSWIRLPAARENIDESPRATWPTNLVERIMALAMLAILLLTLITAIVAPPNTPDALTYHLPRVVFWQQNGSVAHFATHEQRQIFQAPWAEFALLNLHVLSGADTFDNLLQWSSLVLAALAASLVAEQLGGNSRAQWLAALVVVTLPNAIAQASSSQTDLMAAFWFLAIVYLALQRRLVNHWANDLAFGAALGIGLLTKATLYVLVAPLLAVVAVESLWRQRARAGVSFASIAALALAINGPHFARNVGVFGDPLGTSLFKNAGEYQVSNGEFSPQVMASNLIRSLGSHLATSFPQANGWIGAAVGNSHRLLGISPHDRRTTYAGANYLIYYCPHEDFSGNFWHVFLGLGVVLGVLGARSLRSDWSLALYTTLFLVTTLLFMLYLKWQLGCPRLHLPLFVMLAPLCAIVVARARSEALTWGVALVLLSGTWPCLLQNLNRPLIGWEGRPSIFQVPRSAQYFANLRPPSPQLPYETVAARLSELQVHEVGLIHAGGDVFEYPLLKECVARTQGTIRHVNCVNQSAVLELATACDALIAVGNRLPTTVTQQNRVFKTQWQTTFGQGSIALLLPETKTTPLPESSIIPSTSNETPSAR